MKLLVGVIFFFDVGFLHSAGAPTSSSEPQTKAQTKQQTGKDDVFRLSIARGEDEHPARSLAAGTRKEIKTTSQSHSDLVDQLFVGDNSFINWTAE